MITKDNRVVLVNQYRHAGGRAFFEVPAGMKEAGETNEEAIAREVKEETGICLRKHRFTLAVIIQILPWRQTKSTPT
ncbi:NUDIX hydrolase [Geomicrobium sp. JCM 19039]|uniref:NUDIX hydrolase n=1 Tax=Geomicrobium sp. JCM 19039 TaxID=1460636 RepID=UPI00045F169F|nr:hypothetical protein JCM19039_1786 [Geomicrobium sp. JCM 19039]